MISGRDFVVFSDDWGRHPFSCQHLMNVFLKENRILWVNTIGLRNPTISLYDAGRIAEKAMGWLGRGKRGDDIVLPENLTVVSPFMVPWNQFGALRAFNRRQVVSCVRSAMEALEFDSPLVVATVPNAADYIGRLGERLFVFYCVDEFSEWPGVNSELVKDLERTMLSGVDMVAAVSDRLAGSKKAANGPTYLLTHGVDIEHFRQTGRVEPAEIYRDLPGPVIGYFGLIDERTDQDLLIALLERFPEASLVLIGNTKVSLSRLTQFGNFHHIPPVRYELLPRYIAGFDVAIIPYVVNALSNNINPLKLKEYMASGVPIVSTPLPEVVKFDGVIRVGSTAASFADAVESALSDGGRDVSAALAGESWAEKAELLSGWMIRRLEEKGGGRVDETVFKPMSAPGKRDGV